MSFQDMSEEKKKIPPHIDLYRAWCKACGICASFCPTGVLGRDEAGYPYVKDIDKCINCGWCEIRCPDFSITVESREKRLRKDKHDSEEERSPGETAPGK